MYSSIRIGKLSESEPGMILRSFVWLPWNKADSENAPTFHKRNLGLFTELWDSHGPYSGSSVPPRTPGLQPWDPISREKPARYGAPLSLGKGKIPKTLPLTALRRYREPAGLCK
jgi:hypothetical protein